MWPSQQTMRFIGAFPAETSARIIRLKQVLREINAVAPPVYALGGRFNNYLACEAIKKTLELPPIQAPSLDQFRIDEEGFSYFASGGSQSEATLFNRLWRELQVKKLLLVTGSETFDGSRPLERHMVMGRHEVTREPIPLSSPYLDPQYPYHRAYSFIIYDLIPVRRESDNKFQVMVVNPRTQVSGYLDLSYLNERRPHYRRTYFWSYDD